MPFEKRLHRGLLIDRSFENTFECISTSLLKSKIENKSEFFREQMADIYYRDARYRQNWHTKRQVNAKLLDHSIAHEHLIDLSRPALLDMLMSKQPTKKDWNQMPYDGDSKKKLQDKSSRRTMDYYPNVVSEFNPKPILKIKNRDGSITIFPNWPRREDPKKDDERLTDIATAYSLPPHRGRLDATNFVDANYMIRFDRYWREMLFVISDILQNHGPIRPEMEWIVYHIVNKDVGLHILFDNFSMEFESRWFRTLSKDTRMQVAGLPGIESEPYFFTLEDARNGIKEIQRQSKEFEDIQIPEILLKYKISTKSMKERTIELIMAAVDGFDSSNNRHFAGFTMQALWDELQ